LEPLMATARQLNCHILLTHHAGKTDREEGDEILGSTGLLGGVDSSIHIKKRNKESRVFSTIQRYGIDIPKTVIALSDGHLIAMGTREEVEIEETIPKVLSALDEGPLVEKEIWGRNEKDHSFVSKALRKLVEQKKVRRTGLGKRGNPFVYEKDSLLLSSIYTEESKREREREDNLQESQSNIPLEDFDKNGDPQERIQRDFLSGKSNEIDDLKKGNLEKIRV